jgi:hypothetical protein
LQQLNLTTILILKEQTGQAGAGYRRWKAS